MVKKRYRREDYELPDIGIDVKAIVGAKYIGHTERNGELIELRVSEELTVAERNELKSYTGKEWDEGEDEQ